jgi:hypothetical protein
MSEKVVVFRDCSRALCPGFSLGKWELTGFRVAQTNYAMTRRGKLAHSRTGE